ncbi:MAG: hypothetical protein PQJ49_11645 [Sphaerochaetaceae bacterium]|nr:hypothetical protein [Sphaerochaetaceae bacterium]
MKKKKIKKEKTKLKQKDISKKSPEMANFIKNPNKWKGEYKTT